MANKIKVINGKLVPMYLSQRIPPKSAATNKK